MAESVYRRLHERAAALHTTAEQLLEDLVMTNAHRSVAAAGDQQAPSAMH
jgi:hypothetical protein